MDSDRCATLALGAKAHTGYRNPGTPPYESLPINTNLHIFYEVRI